MLGTFHPEGPSDTGGAPAPGADVRPDAPDPVVGDAGLAGLAELVEQVRAGGR